MSVPQSILNWIHSVRPATLVAQSHTWLVESSRRATLTPTLTPERGEGVAVGFGTGLREQEVRMTDEQYMQLAIQIARQGIAANQSPFGAVVVRDAGVVAVAHNTVWHDGDPTAHAEINAIRQAAAVLRCIDLSVCTMFTTCEPCPMCLAAIHWSKISRVVYGASIADAAAAGFSELHVPAAQLAEAGRSPLRVDAGPLREECRELFELWRTSGTSGVY